MLTSSNYKLFQSFMSNNTNIFRELLPNKSTQFFRITGTLRKVLPNNTTQFSRHQVILTISKSYSQTIWHTSRHQVILTFSERYWQTILHTFSELTSNNTDIFSQLLANNTTHFFRAYIINQYWHYPIPPFKSNYILVKILQLKFLIVTEKHAVYNFFCC